MSLDDFSVLEKMIYSGRGITLGMTREGNPFVGYTLTGRSPSSQARKLVYDEPTSTIKTDVTNPEQLKKGNPALLIYPAIVCVERQRIVVSNGVQTNILANSAKRTLWPSKEEEYVYPVDILTDVMDEVVYEEGINITTYEPDAPNFTPRISGCLDGKFLGFHIVRKVTNRSADVGIFSFGLEPGAAKIITTYLGGNENPLLPFRGEPLTAKVFSMGADKIAESLYYATGPRNGNNFRVAAAVMMIKDGKLEVAIKNRSEIGE